MTGHALAYRSINPATGEFVAEYPTLSGEEIEAALITATDAQRAWADRPVGERAAIVARVAKLFAERADDLARIATTEMGKSHSDAVGEVEFCQEIFDYYATEGPGLLADQDLPSPGARARVQRRPLGTILGIMPWNFPFYQVARFAAPNLVAGNAVLLKHAEICPQAAVAIAELLADADVPEGVYTNLFANHDQIAELIADPRVAGVSLTGSERAGAAVAEVAGRNLKKVVLELGGSDPYIVLDAVDVASAARTALETRLYNAGQACNSNKRIIVLDELYDEFVAELVEAARDLRPGDPLDLTDGAFAPMSSRAAAERLAAQVEEAVAQGATLHLGGTVFDGAGAYFQPAVLTDVSPESSAYHEELFGPVAVVFRAASDEDAVRIANDSPYGLGAAVFSADETRATRVAEALEVGMANVNTSAGEGAALPFGGVKRSGFGRELGPLGVDEFVNKRLFYTQETS